MKNEQARRILIPEEILEAFFGQNGHQLEPISVARFGSSGPRVVLLKNNSVKYALKYGNTRVPISIQVENRAKLSAYIPNRLPRIENYGRYSGGEAMLMEAIDGPNLHEAVMLGSISEEEVINIVKGILEDFTNMWRQTVCQCGSLTRDPAERAKRIAIVVADALMDLGIGMHDRVIVNGVEIGRPDDLLRRLLSYERPQLSVLCHSDLNGDNFVLAGDNTWFVVDWEWVGQHDWKLSLSHLIGWWYSNATRLKDKPIINQYNHNTVEISYDLTLPDVVGPITDLCLARGEEVARDMGEPNWRKQLALLMAALLLGDLRFLATRGRTGYKLPLIGEGLRLLHEQTLE